MQYTLNFPILTDFILTKFKDTDHISAFNILHKGIH